MVRQFPPRLMSVASSSLTPGLPRHSSAHVAGPACNEEELLQHLYDHFDLEEICEPMAHENELVDGKQLSFAADPAFSARAIPNDSCFARPSVWPPLPDGSDDRGLPLLPEPRSPEKANDSAVKSIVRRGLFPLGAGLPAAVDPPVLAGIDADDVFDRSGVTLGDVAQRVVL
jgi:hypothetical protein